MEFGRANDKFRFLDWSTDPAKDLTVWAGVIGGAFITLGSHGTDQMMIQRCLAAPNVRDAGKAMVASGFVVFFQFAVFLLIGTALASFYRGDRVVAGMRSDEIYMKFIMEQLPSGIRGMTLAGIFAAAFTGSLNSCASTLVGDFGSLLRIDRLSEAQRVTLSRGVTFVFGLVQIAVALAAASLNPNESLVKIVLTVAGLSAGVMLGVFILGQLPVRVTEAGAIIGMTIALAVVIAVYLETAAFSLFGWEQSPWPVAYPWYPVIGSLLTVGVGTAASLVTRSSASADVAEP
jgi:Na+/proline symporter